MPISSKPKKQVLITDLDNTLFDWFKIWYHPFNAMVNLLCTESGIPLEVLLEEIKLIHQKHGTAEYAFLLEEIPSLKAQHSSEELTSIYANPIRQFQLERRKYMELYPQVLQTLESLKSSGALIVGYTESKAFYTNYRVRKLGLDGLLDYLFSPPDHDIPENLKLDSIRTYSPDSYELKSTTHMHTPDNELKPNPKLLIKIIESIGSTCEQCVYVGDSLVKDVHMAKEASVSDVYAMYGSAHQTSEYGLLRKVTHWTEEMVKKEQDIGYEDINPTYTLENSFAEILNHFHFEKYS